MTKLLRAIACLVLAVAMASVSLAVAAHGAVAVDQRSYHEQTIASELPCSDCGSHRLRVCSQSCAASVGAIKLEALSAPMASDVRPSPGAQLLMSGRTSKPPLTPPIA